MIPSKSLEFRKTIHGRLYISYARIDFATNFMSPKRASSLLTELCMNFVSPAYSIILDFVAQRPLLCNCRCLITSCRFKAQTFLAYAETEHAYHVATMQIQFLKIQAF
jgi:hypothetical protein